MLSSFLFAGLLPLVAAEACSSVVAKTHLVTSVVTTIEYTTLPSDPSCTVSNALPSEPPSSDEPATSSEPTFEWTAPAPPEGTDFEWLPTLEPTPPGPDVTAPTDVVEPPATTDVVEPSSSTCTTDEEKPVTTSSPSASETSPEEQSTTCTTDISESTEVSSVPHTSAAPSDSSASTTAPGKTSATASDEEPCTTSTAEGEHTSAGESASATSGKDEPEVTSTASEGDSEPTSTPAEEGPATTTSAEEDSEATTTSAEETSEATTTSAEESSDATTSHAEETPEATTTTSAEESSEATTTSAEETSEATTSAEESAEPTTSAEESSATSASETSEKPKTTEAPSTFSSVVITTSASSEASTSSEVSTSTSTTSEAPKETKLPRNYPADIVDELQDESMEKLKKWLSENNSNGCTLEKASIRREWGDLTLAQREDYIGAVLCLQSEPSRYAGEIPGARSRFDDFVVTHQAQTGHIHGTANFLTWHRYFLHEFEKALKNECGYKGVMPYWNWDRYANDPENSPLFNGDAGSLGGNAGPSGCVENGPFKDYKVSLGPGPSTRYNPRCLQREMSKVAARYTKVDVSYPLITQSNNVGLFQDRIQSGNNVHAAGHHTVGGNPGADIYTSPGDPYFHLHHAGVDRIFWIWQLQDLNSRLSQVAGQNTQTRRAGSLTETMNLGRNAGDVQLGSLLNTMGGLDGGLCYIYY